MAYWLLKTEPSTYSYGDLAKAGKVTWDGVANPVALKHLRSAKKGDEIAIYHTGDERQVVGTARVVREAYPDPKAKDEKLVVIDIEVGKALSSGVGLATLKANKLFADSPLVRQGRLSVVPLTAEQWRAIETLAKS